MSSVGLVKKLMFGQDLTLHASADVFLLYDTWKTSIKAEEFRPLIPITGGVSFVSGQDEDNRSLQAILFGEDWINRCREVGGGTKNALICLASNFDDQMGMSALALELAMIATKPKSHENVRIDIQTYFEIVEEIFFKDYAGICSVAQKWGITFKEGFQPEPKKTRSVWREELGYDVLIHPKTLEPCRDVRNGSILEYTGAVRGKFSDKCYFTFVRRATGQLIMSDTFPTISVS